MTTRRPLALISSNYAPRSELSNEDKSRLLGRRLAGQSFDEIAIQEQLPKSTVTTAVSRARSRDTVQNKRRSGQPKKYSIQGERRILRYARLHPKWTYADLKSNIGLAFHQTTYRSILQKHGIINWRCKKRPYLEPHYA